MRTALIILLLVSFNLAPARQPVPEPYGDLGDGTYRNPVLVGPAGDVAVCKVGTDYYSTHGRSLDIWHSRDLLTWEKIADLDAAGRGSIWAPDLVHVGGRYFVYTTLVDRDRPSGTQFDNVVYWADNPAGPWHGPRSLNLFGMIDPGLLVDKAGNRWLYFNKGRVAKLADDGLSAIGPVRSAYDGWQYPEDWEVECFCLEAPKFAIRGKYYYMLSAEGGTKGPPTAHMVVVARSESPLGPWENSPHNPLVRTWSADEAWHRQGHGEFTTDAAGNWWMLYTGYNEEVGRGKITLLAPVEWTGDGWPVIPGDFDINQPWPSPKTD